MDSQQDRSFIRILYGRDSYTESRPTSSHLNHSKLLVCYADRIDYERD